MEIINAGNSTLVVRLGREFTDACDAVLMKQLDEPINGPVKWLAVDFEDVVLFDNSAINTLVKLHTLCSKAKVNTVAVGLSLKQEYIFKAAGLDRAFRTGKRAPVIAIPAKQAAAIPRAPQAIMAAAGSWAEPVKKLLVPQMPSQAINLNVNKRRTAGPLQGFGQLWEKTYRIDVTDSGLKPEQIIDTVKKHFPLLQPEQNRFYPSVNGIKAGEVVLINADTPGGLVATGVQVLYASDSSFTFITPQGHPEAGWVTFKAFEENGRTIMQIRGLARASDPVYEIAFRLAGSDLQKQIWTHVLQSLARLITSSGQVQFNKQCLDESLQWSQFFNIFQNAQIFSMLYTATHPFRKNR